MDQNDIHTTLPTLLSGIASDIEPKHVDPRRNLRNQFAFDSMDALHFAPEVSETFVIGIVETDYPALASPESAEQFMRGVSQRIEAQGARPTLTPRATPGSCTGPSGTD